MTSDWLSGACVSVRVCLFCFLLRALMVRQSLRPLLCEKVLVGLAEGSGMLLTMLVCSVAA